MLVSSIYQKGNHGFGLTDGQLLQLFHCNNNVDCARAGDSDCPLSKLYCTVFLLARD